MYDIIDVFNSIIVIINAVIIINITIMFYAIDKMILIYYTFKNILKDLYAEYNVIGITSVNVIVDIDGITDEVHLLLIKYYYYCCD